MEQAKKTGNGIVDGVIWKQLLIFFIPIMLGTFFQQLYNTVDAVIVGQFVSKEALASVGGSSAQILNLIIGFFVGLSSGATVIVSQFYGADERESVSKAVHTAMALAIFGGAIMTVLGLICAPFLLRLMNTPAETIDLSAVYLRTIFLATIPNMIYNVGSGILRAIGDSRRPLYFLIVCCLTNVVLDLFFVLVLNMGVMGVAIATSLAQTISAVLVCLSLSRTEDSYRLNLKKIRADGKLLAKTVRIGLPAGLQSVMYALSNMTITTTINGFGTSTVAAWVALGKVDGLIWMISSAFGISIMTFVGQNYGAHRYDRVRKSLKVCVLMHLGVCLGLSLLLVIIGHGFFGLFTTDSEVVDIAYRMLLYMAPIYWLYIPIELLSGSLRGMGNTLVPTLITAAGICVFRVLWMFTVVPQWHEILGVMISYPISWILTGGAFIWYYFRTSKQLMPKA